MLTTLDGIAIKGEIEYAFANVRRKSANFLEKECKIIIVFNIKFLQFFFKTGYALKHHLMCIEFCLRFTRQLVQEYGSKASEMKYE